MSLIRRLPKDLTKDKRSSENKIVN